MEFISEFGTYYVRENGRLHVYMENGISAGFRSFKHTKPCDRPPLSVRISDYVVPSCCDIPSLFDLCMNYVSTNVHNIDSLVGFPAMIAEKIFAAAVNRRVLQTFTDDECASVIRMFDRAYHSSLLEELIVKSLAILDQHMESFSAFSHIRKLDVSGCMLGDNHDYLLHIGHLALLDNLILQNTAVSDDGLRKLTTPARVFGKGPTQLVQLDVSYNPGISCRCGKYLQIFKQLKTLNVTATAVKLSDVSELTSSLNLVLCDTKSSASVEMKCSNVGNVGWAAEIVDDWNTLVSPQAAVQSQSSVPQLADSALSLQCAMFYSKKCRPPSELEAKPLPLTSDSLILVRPAAQLTNACSKRSHVQKSFLADNRNILNSEDPTDTFSDEFCVQRLNVYRGESNSSRTPANTGKTCSRLLHAMNSFQW